MAEPMIARNLRLVELSADPPAGRPWLVVHGLRTAFLVAILLISVVYQVHLGNFLNVEIWLPVYAVLFVNFCLNALYLAFFDKIGESGVLNGALFALDVLAVTLLIYFTGTGQSLFLFLYLVNLILASLVLSIEATWSLAIWTSICFSALLIVSPEVSGQNLYFSLAVNNLAFTAVTALASRLRDQLTAAGERLREARAEFTLLENLSESIVANLGSGLIVVSRNDFVQFFNPQAGGVVGPMLRHQVKIQEICPELGWPWETLIEDEALAFERRDVRVSKDGDLRTLEVVATRFRDADQRIKGWLFLIDDRTETKRLEEAMRQQEKLAAVGQLAAGIAHEIRNPLASISGSIQMMLANPSQHDEDEVKLMRIVDREIDRLNALITEFLDYVRPEKPVDQPVNLNALLQEVIESLQFNAKLRRDVAVRLELGAACEILGHRDKLKQALLNLIINAYQAMDKTPAPRFEIITQDERDKVVLVLRDNGCGIKPENLKRIFEPFHTTKPQGTGLGLAVTHKILESHQARVLVDSIEGEGTRFLIEFPAHRSSRSGPGRGPTEDLIRIG